MAEGGLWRIGVAGCGSSLALYRGLDRPGRSWMPVAVADSLPSRRDAAREAWKGTIAHPSAEAMLEDERLDLMIIATPPATHGHLIRAAADRGVHVLVQKPLARTPAEVELALAACQSKGVGLKVSFVRRHTPAFLAAQRSLADLGSPLSLRVTWLSSSAFAGRPLKPWKNSLTTLGGVLVDLGSHAIDVARWWMGEVAGGCLGLSIVGGALENVAAALLRHKGGATTLCYLSNVEPWRREVYEYSGSRGSLVLERTEEGYPGEWRLTTQNARSGPEVREYRVPEQNPFIEELDAFIGAIREGRVEVDGAGEGRRAVEITTMLYHSTARQGATADTGASIQEFSLEDFFAGAPKA